MSQPRPKLPTIFERAEARMIVWVGTRGVCLLILGFLWTILGVGFLINPMERFSKPGSGGILDFLDKGPGVFIFASMWVVGGFVAIIVAIQRPITCKDDLGFNGIALPPFLWGMGYWWSWVLNQVSDGEFGRPNTYVAGIVYWSITILMMFLSRHLSDHPKGPCIGRRGSYG